MKVLALVFALVSSGAIASDVGAPNRQETNANLALATQEAGASKSWAVEPIDPIATTHQVKQLNRQIDEINGSVARNLDAMIAEKMERLINQ